MNRPIYFPAIDGLRFLAFLLVFIYHFGFVISHFLSYIGWTGVELFFLLSGFLLTKILVAEQSQSGSIQLYKFFMRRIFRIWPLYFLYLSAIVITSLFVIDYPLSVSRLFGNIFFYDNIITAVNGFNKNLATGHLWSISVEEQYYIVLPFLVPWLAKPGTKKTGLFIIVSFILLFVSRYFFVLAGFRYAAVYVLPFSADSFLAGIILGLGTYDIWLKKINSTMAFITGAALLTLLYFLPHMTVIDYSQILTYFIPAVAFFFIFISVVYTERGLLYWIFSNNLIRYLGKISFGLYVFHVIANRITHHFFYKLNEPVDFRGFICSLFITILLAVLSYELIEKHFLKIKNRFTVIKNRHN